MMNYRYCKILLKILCQYFMKAFPAFQFKSDKYNDIFNELILYLYLINNIFSYFADDMWKFLDKSNLLKMDDITKRKILTIQFTRELYLNYLKVILLGLMILTLLVPRDRFISFPWICDTCIQFISYFRTHFFNFTIQPTHRDKVSLS